MSPLGATTTSEGELKCLSSLPATPGVPSVISTLPSGLSFSTVWPLPAVSPLGGVPRPSVTQRLPSLSTKRPCGKLNILAPQLATSVPDASYLLIGLMFEPSQVLPPQRSNTQT